MSLKTLSGVACALVLAYFANQPLQAGQIPGMLSRVDVVSDRIEVIQAGGREYTFSYRPNTSVTLNGEPFPFDMLRAGWRVVIHFDDRTGELARIQAFQ